MHRFLNLSLIILFPIAWFAPLLRAGLLPIFGLSEISVISGLQSLWSSDWVLAGLVAIFALFAPMAKTLLLALIQFRILSPRQLPVVSFLGRLAMADIFLIALYITLAKGIGVGTVQTAWGLYLFSFCILLSLGLSLWEKHRLSAATDGKPRLTQDPQ